MDDLFNLGRRLRADRAVYPLSLGSGEVLFRLDGIFFSVSKAAFDLVSALMGSDVDGSLGALSRKHGHETMNEVIAELLELDRDGLLDPCSGTSPALEEPRNLESQPSGLCLLVSQTCNLACRYCYAGGGTYGDRQKWMAYGTAQSAIEGLLKRSPLRRSFTIIFFGGEPLLNFRLIRQVVALCRELEQSHDLRFNFSLTTNGTILTDAILNFLTRNRFVLMVSYDSARFQDQLRPYRNGARTRERVTTNLRRMVDAGLKVQIRGTLVRQMVDRNFLRAFSREVQELGIRELVVSTVDCSRNPKAPFALCSSDKDDLQGIFGELTAENMERAERAEPAPVVFDPFAWLMKALATGSVERLAGCGACFGMTAVSTEGKMYPFHRFVGKQGFVIGDADSGVELPAIERFFNSHRAALSGRCSDCLARRICGGMCYHHFATDDGAFSPPGEDDCRRFRQTIEKAVDLTLRLRAMDPGDIRAYSESTSHLA